MTASDGAARVLVVGASSGIGRAVVSTLHRHGSQVVASSRRLDVLEALRKDAGPTLAVAPCDVRDEASCAEVVATAIERLGGLDALVYCAGVSPLRALVDADAALWHDVLATNVVGATLVCRAALPHLRAAQGRAVFLSSSSVGRPFPGLVPYAASKAALEEAIRGWRAENPDVSFTTIVVGPTGDTDITTGWDQQLAGEMFPFWHQNGYLAAGAGMTASEVGATVQALLTQPAIFHAAVIQGCDRAATPLRQA